MPWSKRYKIWDFLALACLSFCVILLLAAINLDGSGMDTESSAHKVERIVEKRMEKLGAVMSGAVSDGYSELMDMDIPSDMVVYKYVNDTLKSWNNQFTIINDEVHKHYFLQKITNPKAEVSSPLGYVTEDVRLLNLGPKWYLIKSISSDNVEVIGGLEIVNDNDRSSVNGVNRRLRLSERFSVRPLSDSGGSPVNVSGVPVFKIICDSFQVRTTANVFLIWIALIFFVTSVLIFLHTHKSIPNYFLSLAALTAALGSMYAWGTTVQGSTTIFSPSLYADGNMLYSLGAVIIFNIGITLLVLCTYMVRSDLFRHIRAAHVKRRLALYSLLLIATITGVVSFTFYAIKSIVANSTICLELYNLNDLSIYSAIVYVSFISMLMTIPLMLQLMRPGLKLFAGIRFDALSTGSRLALSIVFAVSLVALTALSGFNKEQSRQEVWANRLSVDRDISLEMQLRSSEVLIANDQVISAIVGYPNTATAILNRITENYMPHVAQNYEVSIVVFDDLNAAPDLLSSFRSKVENGVPVADNSNFIYSTSKGAHASYTGIFTYFTSARGPVHMLLEIEPKANREAKGYSVLLGYSAPGKVLLPPKYSYAKYRGDALVTSRGNVPYPAALNAELSEHIHNDAVAHFTEDGYTHFINHVSDDEVIVISREVVDVFSYVLAFVFLALVIYFALSILALTKRNKSKAMFEKSYYKSRVTSVLVLSLLFTLVAMASVSVLFVYRRNDANLHAMMVDKVNSIQGLIQNTCKEAKSFQDLDNKEFKTRVERTAGITKTDISLYDPSGKVFYSTTPEIFDKMLLGSRIDQESYNAIVYKNRRYYIHKEQIGDTRYYALHAPIYNEEGKMLAITSSPFTDDSYDFELDAVRHFVTILTLFLILLILARFSILAIVDRIFKPLMEMGKKMNAADIGNLEYISYDSEDELTSLVDSYNRMVKDLSESTKQLAQAERDKAWSAMARQVAHEIKNPLTPMKLQIQRLIRLKQKNAPGWQDKFDEVVGIVLDHIDILTDTANEFSTFAKLYSETPSLINLDLLLQEEIAMFDNKENITFSYLGLENALVSGPKPQLTRVFVNLITNAVQAVEIRQQEDSEAGDEPVQGQILIQLRNSSDSDYYDIVFEDNGPGVAEENQSRLFTPNFTTKSSGTGLGLAICRSILEKCKAQISYSKSFNLKGACFLIRYPKTEE